LNNVVQESDKAKKKMQCRWEGTNEKEFVINKCYVLDDIHDWIPGILELKGRQRFVTPIDDEDDSFVAGIVLLQQNQRHKKDGGFFSEDAWLWVQPDQLEKWLLLNRGAPVLWFTQDRCRVQFLGVASLILDRETRDTIDDALSQKNKKKNNRKEEVLLRFDVWPNLKSMPLDWIQHLRDVTYEQDPEVAYDELKSWPTPIESAPHPQVKSELQTTDRIEFLLTQQQTQYKEDHLRLERELQAVVRELRLLSGEEPSL
jgi:hypothetical protein